MDTSKMQSKKARKRAAGVSIIRTSSNTSRNDDKREVGGQLSPLQMGCGVSGGSEIAPRMAQVFLDAHPEHVLIKTDFKNAFNLTPRNLMLAGLHSFCPRLIPWFRWAYGEASPLVL